MYGDDASGGAYILGLSVSRTRSVTFGRYRGGEPVVVPKGSCVYVGSALGAGAALWCRLTRHARRSGDLPSHRIGRLLRSYADRLGGPNVSAAPIQPKRLRWHVDYLLDADEVSLDRIIAVRTRSRVEPSLAALVDSLPQVVPVAPGLGAGDAPGKTHLWAAPPLGNWWPELELRVGAWWAGREPVDGRPGSVGP